MAFLRLYTSLYWCFAVTMALSCIISKMQGNIGKNCEVFIPHLHSMPLLRRIPLEFLHVSFKNRIMELSAAEKVWVYVYSFWYNTQTRQTDGQTDRQMDRHVAMHSVVRQKLKHCTTSLYPSVFVLSRCNYTLAQGYTLLRYMETDLTEYTKSRSSVWFEIQACRRLCYNIVWTKY